MFQPNFRRFLRLFSSIQQTHRRRPRPASVRLQLEELELRLTPASATPFAHALPSGLAGPASGTGLPYGYAPSQIRHAYGFDQITFNGGTVQGDGSGQTIAIVDAYDQ